VLRVLHHLNLNEETIMRIVFNKLLAGWYIVRGPHQSPIGGRYETKAAAREALANRQRGA
jgi:hypothetical protein